MSNAKTFTTTLAAIYEALVSANVYIEPSGIRILKLIIVELQGIRGDVNVKNVKVVAENEM